MKQSEINALRHSILEVMNAMLVLIDKDGATTPTTEPNSKTAESTAEPTPAQSKKRKRRKKKNKSYRVEDLRALYRLADAGLLHYIRGTEMSKDYPDSYVYFIERNPETKAALAAFLTQEELAENV